MKENKHFVSLGKLPSKYLCPYFENDNVTIISMNYHVDENLLPHVDLWFDLHEEPQKENADYKKQNFPFELCHELVGGKRFCCTMAYMIAWCIIQGAEKISIYGCKYVDDGNVRRQRELHNVRELLMFALGRGVEIEICSEDKDYLFPEHRVEDGQDFDQ